MSSTQQLLFLVGSGLGAAIIYKLLLGSHGKTDTKENMSVLPEHVHFYGDDQMTHIGGYLTENRLAPNKARMVSTMGGDGHEGHMTGLAHVGFANAVFEAEPSQLMAVQTVEPPVQFVSEYF